MLHWPAHLPLVTPARAALCRGPQPARGPGTRLPRSWRIEAAAGFARPHDAWDAEQEPVRLSFALPYRCEFGQHLAVIGSLAALGAWEAQRCLGMHWSDGDVWRVELDLPTSLRAELEYKYVVRNDDGYVETWKPGDNLRFRLPAEGGASPPPAAVRIRDAWDGSHRTIEMEVREDAGARQTALAAARLTREAEDALQELRAVVERSSALLEDVSPVSPEALAADRAVASAAEKATELTRALDHLRASGELPSDIV